MHCPEDDPSTFNHLVNYFYRNALPQPPSKDASDEFNTYYTSLEKLFFLAEKLCMNELSNKAMDAIQDAMRVHKKAINLEGLERIYQNAHESSKFRIYGLLSWLRFELGQKITEDALNQVEKILSRVPEIARDYLLFQLKQAGSLKANKRLDPDTRSALGYGKCFFHTHAEGETCHLESSEV
jgi:hypothetical protein